MSASLTRESAQGTSFDRLLVNGQPAAIVGPVQEEAAELLVAYFIRTRRGRKAKSQ
jgi:hypothetical protein